jgi:hypothetical protein
MRSNCQTRLGLLPQALKAVRPLDTVRFIGARRVAHRTRSVRPAPSRASSKRMLDSDSLQHPQLSKSSSAVVASSIWSKYQILLS